MPETSSIDDDLDGFQLFGGVSVSVADAMAEEPLFRQERPQDHYFYHSSPRARDEFTQVAISGTAIIAFASKYPQPTTAPDINADYKPTRRKCRLGKTARIRRRAKLQELKSASKNKHWHRARRNLY